MFALVLASRSDVYASRRFRTSLLSASITIAMYLVLYRLVINRLRVDATIEKGPAKSILN